MALPPRKMDKIYGEYSQDIDRIELPIILKENAHEHDIRVSMFIKLHCGEDNFDDNGKLKTSAISKQHKVKFKSNLPYDTVIDSSGHITPI